MKFSLREVFNIHTDESTSSETASLLESYGLNTSTERNHQDDSVTLEGIQNAVNQLLEGRTPEIKEDSSKSIKRSVNRDDLVLDRWRKMAGL